MKQDVDYKFIYKPSEKDEILEFIKKILDMDYEWYRESFKQNRLDRGIKIMKFFQMPWTPLHAKFRSEIIDKQRKEEEAIYSQRVEARINRSIVEAKSDERTRDNDSVDMNYFIIKTIDLVNGDSILQIGIPYMKRLDKGRADLKFAFQILIHKHTLPTLFTKLRKQIPAYKF